MKSTLKAKCVWKIWRNHTPKKFIYTSSTVQNSMHGLMHKEIQSLITERKYQRRERQPPTPNMSSNPKTSDDQRLGNNKDRYIE
jgi:hypothetical protein